MTFTIPVWFVVMLLAALPFGVGWLVAALTDSGGFFDFSPLYVIGAFAVTAGICWTGLIVWAVMR